MANCVGHNLWASHVGVEFLVNRRKIVGGDVRLCGSFVHRHRVKKSLKISVVNSSSNCRSKRLVQGLEANEGTLSQRPSTMRV